MAIFYFKEVKMKRNRNGANEHMFSFYSCQFCDQAAVALENGIHYCMAHWWKHRNDPSWIEWEDLIGLVTEAERSSNDPR